MTDTKVVDLPSSQATGKLILNGGYNANIQNGSQTNSNTEYISARASTISVVSSRLSDLSITYLMLLVAFFGIWGAGGAILRPVADKLEGQQNHDKKVPYIGGILAGLIFFYPVGNNLPGIEQLPEAERYSVHHTRFQDFERSGYYLFMDWAHDAAKIIVDAELDNIIARSGIASKDTIVYSFAALQQAKKAKAFYEGVERECRNVYQERNFADMINKNNMFSAGRHFSTSELYTYASSVYRGGGVLYYNPVNAGGFVERYAPGAPQTGSHYPVISASGCGYAEDRIAYFDQKEKEFGAALEQVQQIQNSETAEKNLEMIKQLIEFQYELGIEWGALSVLGLPVTVMQTEARGILVENEAHNMRDALTKDIKEDSMFMHSIMSTIPYLFVPGMGTTYDAINSNIGKITAGIGAASGGAGGGGVLSVITAAVGGFLGFAAAKVAGPGISLWITYHIATNILALAPILAILLIGILRFAIILIKIFAFHFISIFMMPIMFAKENWRAVSAFALKIFATMVELPVFVLSVWLAMTANNLIQSFGGPLAKRMVMGMLESNAVQYGTTGMFGSSSAGSNIISNTAIGLKENSALIEWLSKIKIYAYDGFIDVGLAVFSIVIVYKIITSIHTSLFEVLEVKASSSIDTAVESMKSEGQSWGVKS